MRAQINLVDLSLLPAVQHLSTKRVLLVVVVALATLTAHYSYERFQLNKTLAISASKDAGVDPLAASLNIDADLDRLQKQLMRDELLRDGLSKLTDLPVDNAQMLADVIAALPDSLWLKELEFFGKHGIRIRGGATDPAMLTEFSAKLAKVPALAGLPVQVVKLTPEIAASAEKAPTEDGSTPTITLAPTYFDFELATLQSQGTAP
ncbi:MAG: hypothetical protein V4532_15175 [Pseudomonadota bacterium]